MRHTVFQDFLVHRSIGWDNNDKGNMSTSRNTLEAGRKVINQFTKKRYQSPSGFLREWAKYVELLREFSGSRELSSRHDHRAL